jgi:hypothetical protein
MSNRGRNKDHVFDVVDWAGRNEEKHCSVILGSTMDWGQTYEFLRSLDSKPCGLMKWGAGRWRVLYVTRKKAEKVASKRRYEWKGMTLVTRLVYTLIKSVIKVKYFLITQEDIAELAKRQGLEVKVISELMQGGLKTERWLIATDRKAKSEV